MSCCRSQPLQDSRGSIEDVDWVLVEVDGTRINTPTGGRQVFMRLSRVGDEGVLKGFAGCNGFGGDYEVDGQGISFQVITTKMYCELQMDVENKLTKMLYNTDRFLVRGNLLELYSGDQLLGTFEARR